MLKRILILVAFSLTLFLQFSYAEGKKWDRDSALTAREDSLIELRRTMLQADQQFLRFNTNEKLIDYWLKTLRIEGSEKYDFNRIDSMYIVTSGDRKLRIVTWHILNKNRTYDMFGIVQAYSESEDDYEVYELHDRSGRVENPEYEIFRQGDWYGALYYNIIKVEYYKNFFHKLFGKKRTYYTLLGWKGKDLKTDIKVIDVASLRSSGKVGFGYSLFRTKDHRLKRIIFEYGDRAPMSLKYQRQYLVKEEEKEKKKNRRRIKKPPKPFSDKKKKDRDFEAQQREEEEEEEKAELVYRKMIVFEKLIPLKPELEGIPSQLIPHPEDYDAFVFKDGRWTYHDNVDARNKPSEHDDYEIQEHIDKYKQLFPSNVDKR